MNSRFTPPSPTGKRFYVGSLGSLSPPSPSAKLSSLVDHVAAANWREVWNALAPYHAFAVGDDDAEAKLVNFRDLLTSNQPLRSSGAPTSVFDLVIRDSSDKVPVLVVEAVLGAGVDVESKSSIWLKPEYNPSKKGLLFACVGAHPGQSFTKHLVGRAYVDDEDLEDIMKQVKIQGHWPTLDDLVRDGKWYALRNRMRRNAIDDEEFFSKGGASGKTCLQILLEKADRGIQTELAYRYPHLLNGDMKPVVVRYNTYNRFDISPDLVHSAKTKPMPIPLHGAAFHRTPSYDNGGTENNDVAAEVAEMRRWLMDLEKKCENEKVQRETGDKALRGKADDLRSQVTGIWTGMMTIQEDRDETFEKFKNELMTVITKKSAEIVENVTKKLDEVILQVNEKVSNLEKRVAEIEETRRLK